MRQPPGAEVMNIPTGAMTPYEIASYEIASYEIALYEIALYEIALYEIALYEIALYEIARAQEETINGPELNSQLPDHPAVADLAERARSGFWPSIGEIVDAARLAGVDPDELRLALAEDEFAEVKVERDFLIAFARAAGDAQAVASGLPMPSRRSSGRCRADGSGRRYGCAQRGPAGDRR
jgi:hypothetical protein